MNKAGRKPKPSALKALASASVSDPKLNAFDLIQSARAPQWLSDDGKKMWRTVVPTLCENKVLAVTDLHNVEVFCMAYSHWREAERDIAERGISLTDVNGRIYKNPACTVVHESLRQLSSFGASLGLEPAARERLFKSSDDDKHDPWDDL